MALESLITALACLSSSKPDLGASVIMRNSMEPFRLDSNSSGCPVGALGGLSARLQYMSEEVRTIKAELAEIQQLIADFRREAGRPTTASIGPRLLLETGFAAGAPNAVAGVDNTPRNCWDQPHGQVRIRIAADEEPFFVNCDQKLRDGGWIVIAHRFDGSEDFNRDWNAYKSGFGPINSEFFIGLDKLHRLTNTGHYELLVVMRTKSREERFAVYDHFSIGSEAEKYLLYVLGTYRGDAGDSLRYHAGKKFTTFDQDNDDNGQNCARKHAGAWWYGRECMESNLFGTFQPKYGQQIGNFKGILWKTFLPGPVGSLHYVRMLIRPRKQS